MPPDLRHGSRSIRGFEQLEPRLVLSGGIIDLGPSDNIALDQPRVAIELLEPLGGDAYDSIGPTYFNTFLLDTGANSVLAMASAVSDMTALGYVTEGSFTEQGVAGDHLLDISAPYRFDFAGTSGERHTIEGARILSDAETDFSMFSATRSKITFRKRNLPLK